MNAVDKYLGDRAELTGDGAGAHVALWPRRQVSEESVVARAKLQGVGVYGLATYYLQRLPRPGFMLGYSRLTDGQIHEGICRLAQVL